jgi:CDP-diacylglycerol pyrophosphatase
MLVVCIIAGARDQSFPSPTAQLINEVVANELTDRAQQRKWLHLINKREGEHTLTEEQADTKAQWKTAVINIHLSGRLAFIKTISKQEYETQSDFRAVSSDLSQLEGSQLLAP